MKLIDDYILDKDGNVKKEYLSHKNELSEEVINYLKSGNGYVSIASLRDCEFCNEKHSMLYMIDGKWMWGKWLIHYIEEHHIKLPLEFITDLELLDYKCPKLTDQQIEALISREIEHIPYK